jgi:hypothetical protein
MLVRSKDAQDRALDVIVAPGLDARHEGVHSLEHLGAQLGKSLRLVRSEINTNCQSNDHQTGHEMLVNRSFDRLRCTEKPFA